MTLDTHSSSARCRPFKAVGVTLQVGMIAIATSLLVALLNATPWSSHALPVAPGQGLRGAGAQHAAADPTVLRLLRLAAWA
jgi:hypothetical protein